MTYRFDCDFSIRIPLYVYIICHPKGNKFIMDVDLVEVITSVYEDSFTGYKIFIFIN